MRRFVFTGEEERDERGRFIIPGDATHVSVHPSVTVIPARLFWKHQNIVELVCHDGVIKIEEWAFKSCPRLRRVIMRGLKVVELRAFNGCEALEYVECRKLERIGTGAFNSCKSLSNINLPSAKIVDGVFIGCEALTEATFGKELESFGYGAFYKCGSLERITIPLKNGLFTHDNIFQGCANLKRVDLVEEAILHETVAALLLEEWRNDMSAEIDAINQILLNAAAGEYDINYISRRDDGEKALVIREWIGRVLDKIINYKGEHRQLLNEAASTLQLLLPNDIVMNNVVSFLELPLHTFDGEDEDDGEENIENIDNGSEGTFEGAGEEEEDDSVADDREDDEEQQQQDDEGGRKRRKIAQNDEP